MKVSIILPIYNVELYLRKCIDSIINQSEEDIEIICIDDCSTDHSAEIMEEYAKRDRRIVFLRNDKNLGLSATRNIGIGHAKGNYIQFVDSDDYIDPETCELLYSYAEEKQADVVYFNMQFLNDEENRLIREKQNNGAYPGVYTGIELFQKYMEDNVAKPEAVRHFINREFLINSEIKFYEGITHEDMLFSFQISVKARKVCDLNKELYVYRQRTNSISWGQKEKRASCLLVCLINIINTWLIHDFTAEENRAIAKYVRDLYALYLRSKVYRNETEIWGNEKEKLIQQIINGEYFAKISFQENDISRIRTASKRVLYGAGNISIDVLVNLKKYGIYFDYVVVTDKRTATEKIDGIQVIAIDELKTDENMCIVVGTSEKFHQEIKELLNKRSFNNIVFPIF